MINLVKNGYNEAAERYHADRSKFKSDKFLSDLNKLLKPGSIILDIGCGSGVPVAEYFIKKGHKVIGIDLSEKQIKLAKKNIPDGDFKVRDMQTLKIGEYQVNAVVSFYAIFHTPREVHQEILNKIASFLPSGGLILLTMGAGEWEGEEDNFFGVKMWWSHYGAEKNKELIQNAGFKIIFAKVDEDEDEKHLVVLARK